MKTLSHIDRVKIVRDLVGGAAWVVIVAIGMILGVAITAQAAPAVQNLLIIIKRMRRNRTSKGLGRCLAFLKTGICSRS